jgi:hypothetical protein
MNNLPVGGGAGAVVQQLQLPWQYPSAIGLLDAEFPRLHRALRLSRHEVDALGGLHQLRLRAGQVPALAAAHSFIAANAIPGAALE